MTPRPGSGRTVVGSPRLPSPTAGRPVAGVRLWASRVLALAGVGLYNWWVVLPFLTGWLVSLHGFFSDLSADGAPHAAVLRRLDLVSAILLLGALLLRGPIGRTGPRPEWRWLVAFTAAALLGARFPYACASELDSSCRALERHLDLPAHHYVHMFAGVTEFTTMTIAIWLAYRRTREVDGRDHTITTAMVVVLVAAYPLLAVAYLAHWMGAIIEPVFFVTFSAMILFEIFEPSEPAGTTGTTGPAGDPVRSR